MNSAKKALVSAKKKIVQNKTKIIGTIAVVATTAAVVQRIGLKQHNDFLKEKGLYDEYWTHEEDI